MNTNKHLNFGVYEATESFKAIDKHSCVCFDDMTLVAVTGPADDKEAREYAELFAAAPAMAERIAELEKALKFYADEELYREGHESVPWGGTTAAMPTDPPIFDDYGEVARQALGIKTADYDSDGPIAAGHGYGI